MEAEILDAPRPKRAALRGQSKQGQVASILRVLIAPLLGIVAPRRAARVMLRASVVALCISVGLYAALVGVIVAASFFFFYYMETSGLAPGPLWAVLHEQWFVGPLELQAGGAVAAVLAYLGGCAVVWLPGLSVAGSIGLAVVRGVRAASATLGWAALLLLVGILAALQLARQGRVSVFFWSALIPTVIIPSLAWLLIWRVSQAMAALRRVGRAAGLGPHCEGCGYSLAVLPSDGRCPECALPAADSLTPGVRRSGTSWQVEPGGVAWLRTGSKLLFEPRSTYGKMRIRADGRSFETFARWNYLAIAVGAWTWVFEIVMVGRLMRDSLTDRRLLMAFGLIIGAAPLLVLACVISGMAAKRANAARVAGMTAAGLAVPLMIVSLLVFGAPEVIFAPVALALWAPLVSWGIQRVIAAAATMMAWWRHALPDGRWAERVAQSEAVVMWVFCTYWGAIMTSLLAVQRNWMTDLLGQRFCYDVFGMEAEPAVMIFGSAALGLMALYRYRIAFRAVRWGNF